ncbi:ABC transporter permease [Opitutus terrae]|uniref:Binding-protein-dependent transport systems inner membrane component n=1 Tax=Opitutus terrae (strain DSM 11246 / JCM 15787 / PB90-1) TaxID=452637 RepID=B1ZWB4_OPITP|nr:iron ABC transporter permease [Opitutus terrae]ACB76866.1 binding-protein-dependent transport systems inner membrane component [Opitutus terrae PB90-1]
MSLSFSRCVAGIAAVFFGVFLVWPILQIISGGFVNADGRFTLAYLSALLADPIYLRGLGHSVLLGAATTAAAVLLGLPLAWIGDRFLYPGQRLLGALVLVPMILPPFVGAIGLKQVFGQYGSFNALLIALGLRPAGWTFDWFAVSPFWGIVVAQALSLFPIIYLNAAAALANVDPTLDEAAQNLGCAGWRRFFRITLPLIRPGLFAGGTIVFIWAFTELGTPLVFDYAQVTSVQIYDGLKDLGANPFPYALVAVMLAASLALYALGKGLFGRGAYAGLARAGAPRTPRRLPPRQAAACTAVFAGVVFVALLPHFGVIAVAFARDWYATVLPHALTLDNFALALSHDLTVSAIGNSLKFAAAATVIDLGLGVALAYVIVRSRFAGRQLLDALAMLPLAVPGMVLAFGYLAMAQEGRWLSFLNPVRDPTLLLIVAYSVRRLPFVVRAAAAGFQQTSVTLEEAARNLGAPPARAVVRITLPLISANLIAGGMLAFAFAMLEVSDSLVLAQKQAFYPITKAILELFQLLGDGKFLASALGVWAMMFLGVTLAAVSVFLGKRLGTLFRV